MKIVSKINKNIKFSRVFYIKALLAVFALSILSLFVPLVLFRQQQKDNEVNLIVDILKSKVQPKDGAGIFFLETTLEKSQSRQLLQHFLCIFFCKCSKTASLTFLQACAVESAALHNQENDIFVLFATPVHLYSGEVPNFIAILQSYPNVRLNSLDPVKFTKGTPAEQWFSKGLIYKSKFPSVKLSDFLRILILWRWGGTHLDLEAITLRSLTNLTTNYVGAVSDKYVFNAIMNLAKHGIGHEFASKYLQIQQEHFEATDRNSNGPVLLTRLLQQTCKVKNITKMYNDLNCTKILVYPSSYFYAIHPYYWQMFFRSRDSITVRNAIRNSYLAHIWDFMSKKHLADAAPTGAFKAIVRKHCPKIYRENNLYTHDKVD